MYAIFASALRFIRPTRKTAIDNVAFQAHYRFTTMFLIVCSSLVTMKQFFGEPINCFTASGKDMPDDVLNNFCWIHATFTLPSSLAKRIGIEVIAPGVEKHLPNQDKTYHKYYQWVSMFLIFQSLMFYLPHQIWKILEGKKMEKLTSGANLSNIKQLACYFEENLGGHNIYAGQYICCEFLNFVNVIGNFYLIDIFLGHQFIKYGPAVVQYAQMNEPIGVNPMTTVFPRLTKCTFYKFGPTGNVEDRDALCVLPLNVINEKIFIFLWFWLVFLAVLSGGAVMYRIVWLCSQGIRRQLFLHANRKASLKLALNHLARQFSIGDWFMLKLVGENLHSLDFRDFINELGKLAKNHPNSKPNKSSSEPALPSNPNLNHN